MKAKSTFVLNVGSRSRAAQRLDRVNEPYDVPVTTRPSKHRASKQPRGLAVAARRRRRRLLRQAQKGTRK